VLRRHPRCFVGISLSRLRIVDTPERIGRDEKSGFRLSSGPSKARQGPLATVVPSTVFGRVDEDDEVELVVAVRSLDEPDADLVAFAVAVVAVIGIDPAQSNLIGSNS